MLGVFPLEGTEPLETEWAPEIEAALFDGFALEFELPFVGSELEAYKVAGQWTFGTPIQNQFFHGTQFIVGRLRHEVAWELTFLYTPGVRFDDVWSALAMPLYSESGSRNISGASKKTALYFLSTSGAFHARPGTLSRGCSSG